MPSIRPAEIFSRAVLTLKMLEGAHYSPLGGKPIPLTGMEPFEGKRTYVEEQE